MFLMDISSCAAWHGDTDFLRRRFWRNAHDVTQVGALSKQCEALQVKPGPELSRLSTESLNIPSGKQPHNYGKWPFIVNFPIENGDFLC